MNTANSVSKISHIMKNNIIRDVTVVKWVTSSIFMVK
jgi:hypothetical protein